MVLNQRYWLCVYSILNKKENLKIFDFSSPGGVLRVLFLVKLAFRFCPKLPQSNFWYRIVAYVLANILIPNLGPAGTRVMWFQPFENAYSVKKSEIFSKNFRKRNKTFLILFVLAYRDDFESFYIIWGHLRSLWVKIKFKMPKKFKFSKNIFDH